MDHDVSGCWFGPFSFNRDPLVQMSSMRMDRRGSLVYLFVGAPEIDFGAPFGFLVTPRTWVRALLFHTQDMDWLGKPRGTTPVSSWTMETMTTCATRVLSF